MLSTTKRLIVSGLMTLVGVLPLGPPARPALAAVLATADSDTGDLRVEVTELKRGSGGTVSLKFTMINKSSTRVEVGGYKFADPKHQIPDHNSVGGVHLIDAAGRKKYLVVRDTNKQCVCSREIRRIEPGARLNLYVTFPAPPVEVQKVTVVIPHFSPMDDVTISQ